MDKVGHEYCWEASFDRYVKEYEDTTTKKAGKAGAKWSHTCGDGSVDGSEENKDKKKVCEPSHQAKGQCFWDGTPDNSKVNQTTRETQWSENADRCIMWTPCGVKQNGKPVMIEYKGVEKKEGETPELIQRTIPAETKTDSFNVKDSIYIYGHVTDITREAIDSTQLERKYSRHVYETEEETWRRYPARTWVRVEIPVYNDVTYFFNVLRKVAANSSTVESYTGVSAVTSFYHKTQLYSDTTILIIAGVVVVALLFLLIPFIFTKRQIKAHLRKVYEKHKARGQAQPKETEGEAGRGDNVVKYADETDKDTVVGYAVQDIAAAEKQDPSMKKDASEPSKGGNSDK
jgi:hypothetical protein